MTIHFFTFSDRIAPSSRQRAFCVAEELERRGFSAVIHPPTVLSISRARWPKKGALLFSIIRSLFSIKRDDIIFLQRTVHNKYFFVIMACYVWAFRRKMIFDFDDPIYVYNPTKVRVFCKLAGAVITCTHAQGVWARRYNPKVHVIHIAIDPAPYKKFEKDYGVPAEQPVIGWLGTGPEHMRNLPILVPVLRRLAAQSGLPFTFVLIGAFKDPRVYALFQDIPGLDVRFIDKLDYIDPKSAPKEIQKFDIGVVPQQNELEWDKAKTSMKVLEYMACAVPAVVSNFGEMPYIIKDNVNGFVASSEDEWVEKLTALLRDPGLCKRLGYAGQQTVRERYSFDAIMPRIVEVLNELRSK